MAEIVMTSGFVFNGYIHQVCDDGGITSGDDLGVALIKNEYNNQIHPIAQETYDNISQYVKEGATTVIEGVGVERVCSQETSSYFVKITAPENSPSTSPSNVFPISNASGTGSLVIYTNPNSSDPADKVLVCWFGLSEEVTASTFDLSFDDSVILKYSPAQTYLYDIVTSAGDGKVKVDDTDTYPGFLYNKILPGEGVVIGTSAIGGEKFLQIGTSGGNSLWEYSANALRPKDLTNHLEVYANGNIITPIDGEMGYALTINAQSSQGNGSALDIHGSQSIHNSTENLHSLYISHNNTNAQAVYVVQRNTSNAFPAFQIDNSGLFNTVRLHSNNTLNELPVFHIQSSGTGAAINVQGNGPAFNAAVATSGSIMTLVNDGPGGVNIQSSGSSATLNVENLGFGSVLYVKGNTPGPAVTIVNTSGVAGIITGNTPGPSMSFYNNGGGSAATFVTSGYPAPTVSIENTGNGPGLTVGGGIQIDRGTTEPTGKFAGMPFYNTTLKKYRYYDGTDWKDIGGAGDGKVYATSSDTTLGYLIEKISGSANVDIIDHGSYIEISAAAGGSGSSNWKVTGNTLSPLVDGNNVSVSASSRPSLLLYNSSYPVIHAEQSGNNVGIDVESSGYAPAVYVKNINGIGMQINTSGVAPSLNVTNTVGYGVNVTTSAGLPSVEVANNGGGKALSITTSSTNNPSIDVINNGGHGALSIYGKSIYAPVIEISQAAGGAHNGIMMYANPTSSKFGFEIWQSNGTTGGGGLLVQGDSVYKSMVQIGNGRGIALQVTVGSTNLKNTYISANTSYAAAFISNTSSGPALDVSTGGIHFGSGTTPPAGNFAGRPFWNTDTEELQIYNGTEWQDIGVEKYESVFPAQLGNYSFMEGSSMSRIFERVIPKTDTIFNTMGVFSLGSGIALQKFSLAIYEDSTSARICSIENANPQTTGTGMISFDLDDTYYLKAGQSYWFSIWSDFNTSTPILATSGAMENVQLAFHESWTSTPSANPGTLPERGYNITSVRPFIFVEYV